MDDESKQIKINAIIAACIVIMSAIIFFIAKDWDRKPDKTKLTKTETEKTETEKTETEKTEPFY
jgi:hypothetical protein